MRRYARLWNRVRNLGTSNLHCNLLLSYADELNQGLMADQDNDDSRVVGGTGGGYSGPVPGFEHPPAVDAAGSSSLTGAPSHVPSQVCHQGESIS